MDYLDLTCQDPESYEGKLITVNGCEYEVGAHLGTGSERIVHNLINRKAKLCLHVLKIQRIPRPAGLHSSEVRAKLAAGQFDFAKIIPISIEIQVPGGTGELQVNVDVPHEDPDSPTAVLMQEGDKLLDSGEFQQAISIYNRVLELNPYHTVALVNLAAAQKETQDLMGAWESTGKAIEIEPNALPYHHARIVYAAEQGLLRFALQDFHKMKSIFLNVHDLDGLGARLHLACGDPENAVRYVEECLLDDPEKEELRREAAEALAAKSRAIALMEKAGAKVRNHDMMPALELLKEARAVYNRDPILNINLGLALQRAGDFKMAAALLGSMAMVAPEPFVPMCHANIAFCLIEAGDFPQAIRFLGATMSCLTSMIGKNEPVSWVDLPGKGIFIVGKNLVEESPPSAQKLIDYAVKQFSKHEEVPEDVLRLVGLYRNAASHWVKSST